MTGHIIRVRHYADIDIDAEISVLARSWRVAFPNFVPGELVSDGDDGSLVVDLYALLKYQAARIEWGRPLGELTSAYRTARFNRAQGGALKSQHILGCAFDTKPPDRLFLPCLEALFRRHGAKGIGRYKTFIHSDWRVGHGAVWGAF